MKQWIAGMAFAVCAACAHAQFGVYAMGSAGKVTGFAQPAPLTPSTVNGQNGWSFGGTVGLYDNFRRFGPLDFGGDVRGLAQNASRSNGSYGNQIRGGLTGLRLALHAPLFPVKPYIQAELGGVSTNYTAEGQSLDSTVSGAYQVQIGADFTVFPHLDVRAEYGAGQLFGLSASGVSSERPTLQQLGLGAVVRF